MSSHTHDIAALAAALVPLPLEDRLATVAGLAGRKVFTTSLGIEDQVVTAAIAQSGADVEIATLETGRLFPETLDLIDRTERDLGVTIRRFYPDAIELEAYVARYGRDGFYESVEARHACCDVRKLKPLAKALAGADVWLTGVRRGQSAARADTPAVEWDAQRGLLKVNPLFDWDIEAIRAFAETHAVPLNPLHDRGYPSIGCEPCTRAIKPGEPERAGRWWWEQDLTRECGLHVKAPASPSIAETSPLPQSSPTQVAAS